MPHKHTRSLREADPSAYDLPPTSIARPLPVAKSASSRDGGKKKRKNQKRLDDDTPRAFARILDFQRTGRKPQSLDDGERRPTKKRKVSSRPLSDAQKSKIDNTMKDNLKNGTPRLSKQAEMLKILPGERLSDFSARVNQAMPLAGLARKNKQIQKLGLGKGIKERQTKMEKRMQKMQAEWRAEDAKIKEREEEARELREEEEAENWGGPAGIHEEAARERKSKRVKRLGSVVGPADHDEDPWAVLESSREQRKGLNDYAQEPPKLKVIREKLKVRNGAVVNVNDVPVSAGSLRKREELGSTRKDIIESYRNMMQARRNQA